MDSIITLQVVKILPMLILGMILINIQLLEYELVVPMDMTNLLIVVALLIEVLDTISMVLSPEQPPRSYFPNYGSSSKSSQPTHSIDEQFFQPRSHYANYCPDLYTRRRTNDDDDFEPPRHSTWY